MNWIIYEDGIEINQIYASEEFTKAYCERHGYTYEQRIDPEPAPTEPEPKPEPTAEELLDILMGVTTDG